MTGTRFSTDTAVARVADGVFDARIDRGWWIVRGPNGGYVAAILQRAINAVVDDPARHPRSLTVHFVAPPVEGPARVEARVERRGRSNVTATARLFQGDRLLALALAASSPPWPGPDLQDRRMPRVPPPESCPPGPTAAPDGALAAPPIVHRYEMRWAIGVPPGSPGSADEAVAGGWIRFSEPEVTDAAAIAAITDAWVPPVFQRVGGPIMVPTVDLTVHYRSTLPLGGARADDWLFTVFRTTNVQEGFLEEDGEVWSADGTLLAQSRQLAVAIPFVPPAAGGS